MRPIFVGGCERSGTTMLGTMLGEAQYCVSPPESLFKTQIFYGSPEIAAITSHQLMSQISENWRFRIWEQDLSMEGLPCDSGVGAFPLVLAHIVQEYSRDRGKPLADIWIDHTPNNICHAALLKAWFPEALFIHVIRDGRAVSASVLPLDWGPNTVLRSAQWWEARVGVGLAAEQHLAQDVLQVRFEELVQSPGIQLKRICRFAGIEYSENMVHSAGLTLPKYIENQHRLVGRAPDTSRIDAWKQALTSREIEIFELLTGDLLEYLSYPKISLPNGHEISRVEKLIASTYEFYRGALVNRLHRKRRRRPYTAK